MLSRLAAPVTHFLKGRKPQPQPVPEKGVSELLVALAAIRAKKAQLEEEERALILATRERFRREQEVLEELKRKVNDCGIEVLEGGLPPSAPSVIAAENATDFPSQRVLL